MCLKCFKEKRTSQYYFGNGSAEDALFGQELVFFCVLECFGGCEFVSQACYNVLRLFEMKPRLAFIRYTSSIDFCKFLAFEEKFEVTMQKIVLASSRSARSW